MPPLPLLARKPGEADVTSSPGRSFPNLQLLHTWRMMMGPLASLLRSESSEDSAHVGAIGLAWELLAG